jgi:hypothetical protein
MTVTVVTLLVIAGALQVFGAALAIPGLRDARRSAENLADHRRELTALRLGLMNLPGGEGARTDAILHEMRDILREIISADRIASKRSLEGAGCFAAGTILATAAAIIAVV